MAKAKKKSKAKAKNPLIGHNSDQAAENAELLKIAKAQRSLDTEKSTTKKDWRDREKALTERLEKITYTRDQFKEPYKRFCELADCKDDSEAETVRQNHRVFLAQQRKAFDALGQGDQIDWVRLIQDADEIQKLRDQEEKEREEKELAEAEAAAEGGDEPNEKTA